MIPLFMWLRIEEDNKTKINLPLPLFIAWIILFCLFLILLPLILIAAIVLWILGTNIRLLTVFPILLSVLFALSGLLIHFDKENKRVYLLIR